MQEKISNREFWVHALLFICIAGLVGGYFFILSEVAKLKNTQAPEVATQNVSVPNEVCDAACQAQIARDLAGKVPVATAGPTASPQTIIIQQNAATTQGQRTTYVPFSGPFSTTATDWTDVSIAQAYVDLKNNYSANAYVTFQASIHAGQGGEVHARLYDATNNIAVNNSEIITASTSSTLVSSGQLSLWNGNNLYKVQIKSLNSVNVTFDNGAVKIVY